VQLRVLLQTLRKMAGLHYTRYCLAKLQCMHNRPRQVTSVTGLLCQLQLWGLKLYYSLCCLCDATCTATTAVSFGLVRGLSVAESVFAAAVWRRAWSRDTWQRRWTGWCSCWWAPLRHSYGRTSQSGRVWLKGDPRGPGPRPPTSKTVHVWLKRRRTSILYYDPTL